MNILDAFFITLGFDTSEFDKKRKGVDTSLTKLGETSDKETKRIAESGKKAAHTFSLLKVEVLGALAAFGMSTGFKDFVQSNVAGNAALGRTARNLNMSAAELKAWGFAAEGMGGKADDATNALSALAKGLADAKIHGTSPLIQASRRFGFRVSQDPEQTMINISRRMAETHDRQQAMLIAEAAGVGNIANLLMVGPDKLTKMIAQLRKYTGSVDTKDAIALQWQLMLIHLRLSQINDKIFAKVGPILEKLGTKFANWLDSVDWDKVIARMEAFIDKVKDFLVNVNKAVAAIGGWKVVAEALAAVLGLKLAANLLGLIGSMAKFVAGAGAMTGALSGLAWGAGLVSAGFAGWKIGQIINDNLSQATKDKIGQFTAMLMALAGSTEAQKAIEATDTNAKIAAAMEDPNIPQDVKAAAVGKTSLSDPAVIRLLSAFTEARAQEAGRPVADHDPADHPSAVSRWLAARLPAIERNNPGNIVYVGQSGAMRDSNGSRFAQFGSMPEGIAAEYQQLQRYMERDHLTTIRGIVNKYAPKGDHNDVVAYIANLSKWTGRGADEALSTADIPALIRGINRQEGNSYGVTEDDYRKGLALAGYVPAMAQQAFAARYGKPVGVDDATALAGYGLTPAQAAYARGLVQPAPVMRSAQAAPQGKGGSTSSVSIGTLNVNAPKATDAKGVAKGMQSAMVSHPLIGANVAGLA